MYDSQDRPTSCASWPVEYISTAMPSLQNKITETFIDIGDEDSDTGVFRTSKTSSLGASVRRAV